MLLLLLLSKQKLEPTAQSSKPTSTEMSHEGKCDQ